MVVEVKLVELVEVVVVEYSTAALGTQVMLEMASVAANL
jgi:hypothetical protein